MNERIVTIITIIAIVMNDAITNTINKHLVKHAL